MRLSDIIGHMNLAIWPSIGLIIFLTIFFFVLRRVFSRRRTESYAAAKLIPLRDDAITLRGKGDE